MGFRVNERKIAAKVAFQSVPNRYVTVDFEYSQFLRIVSTAELSFETSNLLHPNI